jgi:hypothetical protein
LLFPFTFPNEVEGHRRKSPIFVVPETGIG